MLNEKDVVDDILDQWSEERPELDTASLGIVIRVMTLNRSFAREATKALQAVDLELWEYDVLSALRRQGTAYALPATVLARETDLSTGAMTNRIDRLAERGLVGRQTDAADRRSVIIFLTAAGRELIDAAIRHRLDAADESLQSLVAGERRQLADLLRSVVLDRREI